MHDFFQNTLCEYFPCHNAADRGSFNCLFCYCPLYAGGSQCGGDYTITDKGHKDCTACLFPHRRENYSIILDKLRAMYGDNGD